MLPSLLLSLFLLCFFEYQVGEQHTISVIRFDQIDCYVEAYSGFSRLFQDHPFDIGIYKLVLALHDLSRISSCTALAERCWYFVIVFLY